MLNNAPRNLDPSHKSNEALSLLDWQAVLQVFLLRLTLLTYSIRADVSFALDSFPFDTFTRSVVSLRIVQNAVRKTSREIVFRSSYCSSVV